MSRTFALRNRQRARPVDTRLLRRIAAWALETQFHAEDYELGIHLVTTDEMAGVNKTFLNHEGSTDVITFDHCERSGTETLHGEIFICLDDAVTQAREFGTTWQSELTRYLLHGLLHLHGFDDLTPAVRRRMKREENRLLGLAARQFPLSRLSKKKS
jgi:probable rRNA maturation factor